MNNAIQIGQAVQPSVLSNVERAVKNLKERIDRKVSDSEFCQVIGITPWHLSLEGLKVALAVFLVIVLLCGVAEFLNMGGKTMSMTFEEYKDKCLAIESQMSQTRIDEGNEMKKLDMQYTKDRKDLLNDYYGRIKVLSDELKVAKDKARDRFKQQRIALHADRSKLIHEWRQEHPIPAAIIEKAYEMYTKEGGDV